MRKNAQPINIVEIAKGTWRLESEFYGFTRTTLTTDRKLVESWLSPTQDGQAYTKHRAHEIIRKMIRQAHTQNNIYHPKKEKA